MHKFLISISLSAVFLCCCSSDSVGQDFNELSLVQLELQLNAILKTRRPEEKAFISTVVKHVGEEKIPRRLVNSSFKYVSKRRPYTKYPFIYFVRVLQFQGKRERVTIPEFDFSIYSERQ